MATRGYTLVDVPISDLSSYDSIVRRLEYVRINFRSIILDLPQDCEIILMAGGTPHNQGKVPLLGIYCPDNSIASFPDPFDMMNRLEQWVDRTTTTELNLLASTIEAPTWAQLLEDDHYPSE
jgi:hypothetical protein